MSGPVSTRPGFGRWIAPPRFLMFLALLPAVWLAYRWLAPGADWRDTVAVAFDVAALVFLLSLVPLLRDSDAESLRRHAADNDANRPLVLVITSLLTLVVMAALSGELRGAQAGEPMAVARLIATLSLIWLFGNMVYTLHYAHSYFSQKPSDGGDTGGLVFPGTETPRYVDFAYFSFTLGMTFQTSDVQITNPVLRKVALLHGLAAFIFNLGVVAFTINALGGG